MAHNQMEVELKFPLLNTEEAKKQLDALATESKKGEYQKDIYYTLAHRNFVQQKPIRERLRLRESAKGCSLDYKNWHYKNGEDMRACDELVVKIDNIDAFRNILNRLDFQELVIVEKTRDTWQYKNVEIAIDEVTELGSFVELEMNGAFESTEKALAYLHEILDELQFKVGPEDIKGYPHLLLEKKNLI